LNGKAYKYDSTGKVLSVMIFKNNELVKRILKMDTARRKQKETPIF